MTTKLSALDTLLAAAILAPSGDNTQPWRFTVNREERTILLDVDPSRDPSPMNAGQRMAIISLGAALENMARTAERNQWEYEISGPQPNGLVQFTLKSNAEDGTIDPLLSARVTNRRVYSGGPISPDCLTRLVETAMASPPTTTTALITDPDTLTKIAELISKADAIMLGTKAIRKAFLEKVRFDAPVKEEVTEGLSLGSLEVGAADRLSLRVLNTLPVPDQLLRLFGARLMFKRVAGRLAASASGICIISSAGTKPQDDLHVGRAWQSIWLRCTEENLACQPMMSLLVLRNILDNGDASIVSAGDWQEAKPLLERFEALIGTHSSGLPAAMMRFGYADPPTSRVGRRTPIKPTCES